MEKCCEKDCDLCRSPSGWKYGFPKPIPDDRREDVVNWLVESGYPQQLIDSYGRNFYCRFWEEKE